MRHLLRSAALGALALAACSGYIAWGDYYPCDPYYDPYCYDYYYATWSPGSLAATDFDADGRLDLAVADAADGSLWFVRGADGGGFEDMPSLDATLGGGDAAVAAINADGDGRPDLLILDGVPGTLATFTGDGSGRFTKVLTSALPGVLQTGVTRFAHGTLDADAFDDVVTVDVNGALRVSLGTGAGLLLDAGTGDPAAAFLGPDAAQRLAGIHVALGHFDAGPGLDLVVVDGARATLALFPGNGDGTFGAARTVTFAYPGDVLAVAAVTSEAGAPADLAMLVGSHADPAAPSRVVVVRLSDGAYAVGPLDAGTARTLVALDLDADGRTDLLLADPTTQEIRTLHARRR